MNSPNCLSFLRFTIFFVLGAAVYFIGAFVVGYELSRFTYWGWGLACGLLTALLAYELADDIAWTRRYIAREITRLDERRAAATMSHADRTKRLWLWAGALFGAAGGFGLATAVSGYSILLIGAAFLVGSYSIEAWRVNRLTETEAA